MARMETTRLLRSTTEDEVNSHNNFTKSAVKIILILLSVVATVGILARKGHSSSSSFLRASSSLSSLSLTDLEGNSQTSTLIISTFSDRYPDFERATKYPFLDPKHGLLIEPHRKTTITVQSSIPAEKGVRYIWDIGVKPKASLERLVSSSSTERIESYSSGEVETPQASIVIERTQTGVYSLVLTEERFEDNIANANIIYIDRFHDKIDKKMELIKKNATVPTKVIYRNPKASSNFPFEVTEVSPQVKPRQRKKSTEDTKATTKVSAK